MQNKYAGDIGDYSKFGLLRFLVRECTGLSLGVNWYLVPSEDDNNDGRFTDYLFQDGPLQRCDPGLIGILRRIVGGKNRNVAALEASGVIPKAKYYSASLNYQPRQPRQNRDAREVWFKNSLSTLNGYNLIFVDPDNGLQTKSCAPYGKKGSKYVLTEEVRRYYVEQRKTVILYNHRCRMLFPMYAEKFNTLGKRLGVTTPMPILSFSKYGIRDYAFVIRPEHEECIVQAIAAFMASPWGQFFKLPTGPESTRLLSLTGR